MRPFRPKCFSINKSKSFSGTDDSSAFLFVFQSIWGPSIALKVQRQLQQNEHEQINYKIIQTFTRSFKFDEFSFIYIIQLLKLMPCGSEAFLLILTEFLLTSVCFSVVFFFGARNILDENKIKFVLISHPHISKK